MNMNMALHHLLHLYRSIRLYVCTVLLIRHGAVDL